MPRLDLDGFNELIDSLDRISDIPESVLFKALNEMGEIAAAKVKDSGEAMGVRDPESNVHVLDNIKVNKPKKTSMGAYVDVTFKGNRTRNGKQTRNAAIAFINEYGKRSQQARPFVDEAINKGADAIAGAGGEVILDWMEKEFTK